MKCPNCKKEIKDGKLIVVGADLKNGETYCSQCVDKRIKGDKKK